MISIILSLTLFTQLPTTTQELIGIEAPIIADQYQLMPNDGLLINITGKLNYSYNTNVTYEGKVTINLPVGSYLNEQGISVPRYDVVEAVIVHGLTLKSAQDTLNRIFAKYLKDVSVKLTLISLRKGIVFVSGEVQKPGIYTATPVERVSQIIEKAGGVTPIGSKSNIKLIRNNTEQANINIDEFEMVGNLEANPRVETGDIIYVPAVTGIVTVKGAVFGRGESKLRASALTTEKERISEGVYELNPRDKISNMITKAGGITPWADLSAGYIERLDIEKGKRIKIPIDLYQIIFEKDTLHDLLMRNGDVLVIPPMNTLVYVQGEVTNPGAFLFTPNLKSSDYIGQAGGPTNYANMRASYINRQGKKISLKSNPLVEASDIIVVPRISFKWWQDYATVISAIAIPIATALLYLRTTNN